MKKILSKRLHKSNKWLHKVIKFRYKHISKVKIYKGYFNLIGYIQTYDILIYKDDIIISIGIPMSVDFTDFYQFSYYVLNEIKRGSVN